LKYLTDRKKLEDILNILFKVNELTDISKTSIPTQNVTVKPVKQGRTSVLQKFITKIQFQKGEELDFQKHKWRITDVIGITDDTLLYTGICVSTTPQINVFIKVQPRNQTKTGKQVIYQITDEYNTMRRLQSGKCTSNIQEFIAYGEYKEKMYILISKLYGADLTSIIGKTDNTHIKLLSKKIMGVLKTIHRCGVIHRDIKPANIVFSDNNTNENITLIDFGLSASVYNVKGNRYTTPQSQEGTPVHKSTMMHQYPKMSTELLKQDKAKRGRPMTYMDDIQGAAWTILDIMGGITWKNDIKDDKSLLEAKLNFINTDHKKQEYNIIKELVQYTIDNVDVEIDNFVPQSQGDEKFLNTTYNAIDKIIAKIPK
jgi:serine/threonine protein kinase